MAQIGMIRRIWPLLAIPVAFVAGALAMRTTPIAHAQAPELQAQIIDLAAITDADLGNIIPNLGTLRSRTLVVQPQGTMALQTGNVPKHTHSDANEFQYVISGSGTFWLGDQQRDIHAGDLIIIPKGTVHAGSMVSSGELKVLAIKLPPQAPTDMHMVP
jgi:mannose-6-phosphate isomerase-like protein (cupin superfamily)